MKKINYLLFGMLMILLASCSASRNYAQGQGYNDYESPGDGGAVTYQQFYDGLSPYGQWINNSQYGYVWSPYERGFRPYSTNGRWVYSTMGWTWVSNYSWGWAPFHYGRWMYDNFYGWVWVPGYEWAPAWVAWRGGGGYYGWAPLGPGMNINISFGAIPVNNWCFVPNRYINNYRMDRYYVRPVNNVTIINNTTIINNNYYDKTVNRNYNSGPRVMDVERETNQKIAPVRVVNRTTPGTSEVNKNQIAIYRPEVKNTTDNANVKPKNFQNAPVREFNNKSNTNGETELRSNNGNGTTSPNIGTPRNNEDRIRNTNPTMRTFPGSSNGETNQNSQQRTLNPNNNQDRINRGNINPDNGGQQRTWQPANDQVVNTPEYRRENRPREIAPQAENKRVFKNEQQMERPAPHVKPAPEMRRQQPAKEKVEAPRQERVREFSPAQSSKREFKNF